MKYPALAAAAAAIAITVGVAATAQADQPPNVHHAQDCEGEFIVDIDPADDPGAFQVSQVSGPGEYHGYFAAPGSLWVEVKAGGSHVRFTHADGPYEFQHAISHIDICYPVDTETTEPPVETTEPPVDTTEPPVETTEPPVDTTEPPTETTEPPVDTTEPPTDTTEPPVDTTEPPVVTEPTVPEPTTPEPTTPEPTTPEPTTPEPTTPEPTVPGPTTTQPGTVVIPVTTVPPGGALPETGTDVWTLAGWACLIAIGGAMIYLAARMPKRI